jgi:hypothetical protein
LVDGLELLDDVGLDVGDDGVVEGIEEVTYY